MGASQSGIKSGTFNNGTLVLNKEDGTKTEVTGFVTSDSLKNFVTPKTIKKDGVDVEDPYVVTSALDAKFANFQATPGPPGKDGESITGPIGPPGKDAVLSDTTIAPFISGLATKQEITDAKYAKSSDISNSVNTNELCVNNLCLTIVRLPGNTGTSAIITDKTTKKLLSTTKLA